MTYADAINYLYSLRLFGAKLGLQNTLKLAALAGDPHHSLRFIHVAGTNGKGSTCAMLESIYRVDGLRVGLFTSPHLVRFSERIQVDRVPIPDADVVRLVEEMQPVLALFPRDEHPTFFEVVTIMALRYFAAQHCDLVIWETGLGGRLDATNIVTPLASVITNIQYDHQKWLGETLDKIAFEKAGIIKPGVPSITATDAPDALNVIRTTAAAQRSTLTEITPRQLHEPPLDTMELPLPGEHQRLNAATALATVRILQPTIPVSDKEIIQGLKSVIWPGRLQIIPQPGGRTLVLDGAHNIAGSKSLTAALAHLFPATRPAIILGVLADKDVREICGVFAPIASQILLTPVQSERSAPTTDLADFLRTTQPPLKVTEFPNLSLALNAAATEPLTVVTGSLYLVGEALELLHQPAVLSERGLNEWGAAPALTSPRHTPAPSAR